MNKFKIGCIAFAAYCAGEFVTTAMIRHRVSNMLKDGQLIVKANHEMELHRAFLAGGNAALSDPQAVREAAARILDAQMTQHVN